MHFCKLCTANPDPVLLLNGTPIAVVEQVKFLDLIFDQQLSFIPHLNIIYPLQAFSSAIFRICGTLHGPSASANLFVLRVSVYSDICVCVCVCVCVYWVGLTIIAVWVLVHFVDKSLQSINWQSDQSDNASHLRAQLFILINASFISQSNQDNINTDISSNAAAADAADGCDDDIMDANPPHLLDKVIVGLISMSVCLSVCLSACLSVCPLA